MDALVCSQELLYAFCVPRVRTSRVFVDVLVFSLNAIGLYIVLDSLKLSHFSPMPIDVIYRLVDCVATPLYGCELWDVNSRELKRIDIIWRKSVRKVCRLCPLTHSNILPFIVNDTGLSRVIIQKVVGFM